MADRSKIEWTNATWTPIKGCTRVSEGCRNCYAEIMAARFSKPGQWGEGLARIVETPAGKDHRWTGTIRFDERELLTPLSWKRPRMVFVCSTADLFHEAVTDAMIDRVFAVMALCPQHTFQILTKRPERMRAYLTHPFVRQRIAMAMARITGARSIEDMARGREIVRGMDEPEGWPLPNVWLGTSVEDQVTANVRIPYLLDAPAAVRWISAEPLLGPVDLRSIDISGDEEVLPLGAAWLDRLEEGETEGPRLDWIVAGGESGPGARPLHPDWIRSIRDQCAAADVPFFFKQWGAWSALEASDGTWITDADNFCRLRPDATRADDGWPMQRVGKSNAGRTLDGRIHDAFPAADEIVF